MWEPVNAIKIWTKSLSEHISHFAIDPHNFGRIAVLGSNLIQFINFESILSARNQIKYRALCSKG